MQSARVESDGARDQKNTQRQVYSDTYFRKNNRPPYTFQSSHVGYVPKGFNESVGEKVGFAAGYLTILAFTI